MTTDSPAGLDPPRSSSSGFLFRWLRFLYDWTLSFAEKPSGTWALFSLSFAEASFFPIPPDVLLIALAVGAPRRALWFSSVCTLGSVAGAAFGYLLGREFYELVGRSIVEFYTAQEQYESVRHLYHEWDAAAVMVAGLTPIPFKVFTIAAGVFQIHFPTFLLASLASRGLRFCLLGALIWRFGAGIRGFIDRHFNWLTVVFVILLVGGFLVLKQVI